ncbi:ABC-three component system middle component 1 [Ruminiclostridium cellulolyticum]|uniref:Uncharacterized protein n=1 Tax=Ruminiclostridium cellulolyticum (strain ATCC 35319 / DSM 5812 / JCM 6584 / H10) TaxID=394503 RepID=B8I498_RUMCH|nr:ABC-three component system middle component 1 [Ruminiclostridium cellulolyticum]ACL74452.1 hypothetical protein Ccel_0064 [Ruminiclostridium cellulolyticum H10]
MEQLVDLESQLNQMFDSAFRIRCYAYSTYGYPVRIICAFPLGNLEDNWKSLNDAISFKLQAQIHNTVERYNIYLLIFELNISTELRRIIESDRYCCRKIVLPESMPENDNTLENLVENRLFYFIEQTVSPDNVQSVQTLINSIDPSGQLLDLIANLRSRISDEDVQGVINIL